MRFFVSSEWRWNIRSTVMAAIIAFETTPDAKGKPCAHAGQSERRCRARTYRRAGYGGTAPHCYLKDAIKPPRHRPCCISGVVR
jgi:hypothetical protein